MRTKVCLEDWMGLAPASRHTSVYRQGSFLVRPRPLSRVRVLDLDADGWTCEMQNGPVSVVTQPLAVPDSK